MTLSAVGCGYAIKIDERERERGVKLLISHNFFPSKVFCREDNDTYYEVLP